MPLAVHQHVAEHRAFFDHVTDGVYFVDRDRVITYWNKAAEQLTGYRADEVIGRSCRHDMLVHVDECGKCLCREGCPLAATIHDGKKRAAMVYLKHKRGHRVPVTVRAMPLLDEDGRTVGAVETFNTVGEAEAFRSRVYELQSQAYVDPLTRLYNRRYLEQTLPRQIADAREYDWQLGGMLMEIDGFDRLHAEHGHTTSNKLVRLVADNIVEHLRAFDIAGRFGPLQLMVLQLHTSAGRLLTIADRMRTLIGQSRLDDARVRHTPTVSIGVTLVRAGDAAHDAFARLISLVNMARDAGGNRVADDIAQG